mmetsp:Transcript_13756/g.29594  ORF Transcript_13756/g.29594 Transcript_13756/m.29594 type:complete len:167 (+) Transcript_13756:260-760(+)
MCFDAYGSMARCVYTPTLDQPTNNVITSCEYRMYVIHNIIIMCSTENPGPASLRHAHEHSPGVSDYRTSSSPTRFQDQPDLPTIMPTIMPAFTHQLQPLAYVIPCQRTTVQHSAVSCAVSMRLLVGLLLGAMPPMLYSSTREKVEIMTRHLLPGRTQLFHTAINSC